MLRSNLKPSHQYLNLFVQFARAEGKLSAQGTAHFNERLYRRKGKMRTVSLLDETLGASSIYLTSP